MAVLSIKNPSQTKTTNQRKKQPKKKKKKQFLNEGNGLIFIDTIKEKSCHRRYMSNLKIDRTHPSFQPTLF